MVANAEHAGRFARGEELTLCAHALTCSTCGRRMRVDIQGGFTETNGDAERLAWIRSVYSMRKALTGSIDAARFAGMMPATAAARMRTPIAIDITGTLTLVISYS